LGFDPWKTDDRRTPSIVTIVVLEILRAPRPELLMMKYAATLKEVHSPMIVASFHFNGINPPSLDETLDTIFASLEGIQRRSHFVI